MDEFPGLTMDTLWSVERIFSTGFSIYTQEETEVHYRVVCLLRRPFPGMARTIDVHLEGDRHFRVIQDMALYARSFKSIHCGARWVQHSRLQRHQATCRCASHYHYIGGPYELKTQFHDLLGRLGIVMASEHRYYPHRAMFDLEACLCNPPLALGGLSQACTCPCPSLRRVMCWDMRGHTISSRMAVPRDWWVICWLACDRSQTRPMAWSPLPWLSTGLTLTPWPFMAGRLIVHGTLGALRMHLSKVRRALESWMRSMPVASFSGWRCNLQLIKPYLAQNYDALEPPWLRHFHAYQGPQLALPSDGDDSYGDNNWDEMVSILKKGSSYLALYTWKLAFLNVCNYLLCQVSPDLRRAHLPGREIFLSLWICGWSGVVALSPATLYSLLLHTAWSEHPGRGPRAGSWPTELHRVVPALGVRGHDLTPWSAGPL